MTIRTIIDRSKSVFFDTAPLIYFIEANALYGEAVKQFVIAFQAKKIKAVSSVITLHEVQVKPYRNGNELLAQKFSLFLRNSNYLRLVSISDDIAEMAARFRGRYASLKMADALQIATALYSGADLFLTNDKQLKQITEISVAVLDDLITND